MLPPLPARPALFLDVDGTLLDLRARPEDVRADAALRHQLERLQRALAGAVAVVSGRALADVDRIFAPLALPAAGLHGLELRFSADGTVTTLSDPASLDRARARLGDYVGRHAGLRLEDKAGALALHFRGAPVLEAEVEREVAAVAAELGDRFHVQRGLLVRELKPRGADKGTAVHAFMATPAFVGRVPVAIGDDLTDQDAFRAARDLGGFGIAVGDRVAGDWTVPGVRALRAWLAMLATRIDAAGELAGGR